MGPPQCAVRPHAADAPLAGPAGRGPGPRAGRAERCSDELREPPGRDVPISESAYVACDFLLLSDSRLLNLLLGSIILTKLSLSAKLCPPRQLQLAVFPPQEWCVSVCTDPWEELGIRYHVCTGRVRAHRCRGCGKQVDGMHDASTLRAGLVKPVDAIH